MYCLPLDEPADSSMWDGHRDAGGDPTGSLWMCLVLQTGDYYIGEVFWDDSPNPFPRVSSESVVRPAVDSLGLSLPKPGVGAYVYKKREMTPFGLMWWVGAPLFLWVDASDPLQWGTHQLSASESGVSITAEVKATSVVYEVGDGSPPVVCKSPGSKRPWKPNDLLSRHSPSKCEHIYLKTNTMGDVNSRYEVSATVIWTVTWTDDLGQSGSFTLEVHSEESASIHVGELRVVEVANPAPTGR